MNFARMTDGGDVVLTVGDALYRLRPGGAPARIAVLPGGVVPNCGDGLGDIVVLGSDRGIDRYTIDGRHVGHIPVGEATFLEPVGVRIVQDGRLLVADGETSCIVETDADGRRVRTFGRWRQPGRRDGRLSVPLAACRLPDGQTLVADWRAHRIARYDEKGRELAPITSVGGRPLFSPADVSAVSADEILVTETGNRCVSRASLSGELRWFYGPRQPAQRTLSFPRSAVPGPGNSLLVCDSHQDRVVVLGERDVVRWEVGERGDGTGTGLSIPRSATWARQGRVCIADGLNGRVVVVGPDGRIEREMTSVRRGGRRVPLEDPHHAVVVGTRVLVVDAESARIYLVDAEGEVVRQWGDGGPDGDPGARLDDPHHAQLLDGGGLLVADSGRNRVVEFDAHGRVRLELRQTYAPDESRMHAPLRYPRCAVAVRGGDILVADTDNARILRMARTGRVRWQIGPVIDVGANATASPELRVPKWVAVDRQGHLIVTDYYNSRIAVFQDAEAHPCEKSPSNGGRADGPRPSTP
jgi:hypothetical protein